MSVEREEIRRKIRTFVANDVLDGKDVGLTYETPLLEWGILNSFEVMRLLAFLRDELGVDVPAQRVVAKHFKNIEAVAELVAELLAGGGARR